MDLATFWVDDTSKTWRLSIYQLSYQRTYSGILRDESVSSSLVSIGKAFVQTKRIGEVLKRNTRRRRTSKTKLSVPVLKNVGFMF
jgi:hypothetical protein